MKQCVHVMLLMLLIFLANTSINCIKVKGEVSFQQRNNKRNEIYGFIIGWKHNGEKGNIYRSLSFTNGTSSTILKNKHSNVSKLGRTKEAREKRGAKVFGEGFSNTIHNDVKKNTSNYSPEKLPAFHKYIENFKTKKIIHPSIRLNKLDKKFMECKESYNKLFSPISETDLFNNFIYTGRQKKGITSPKYVLPKYVERPNYHKTGVPIYVPYDTNKSQKTKLTTDYEYTNIKQDEEIEIIARNCQFARSLMDDISYIIREGITTNDIDIYILNKCVNSGFYPSPLFYNQFPKASCVSINEILCHGIPDNNVLFENDIVKVDISVFRNGFHADMCESFIVKKKGKQEIKRDKQYYDYIYLNDKLKTKYTKFIFKYHFDLTKKKVVRTGKAFTTRQYKYVAPNTKEQQNVSKINERNDWGDEDQSLFNTNYITYSENQGNVENKNYIDTQENMLRVNNEYTSYIEQFNKTYDEHVIYHPEEKNDLYDQIQQFIYNKGQNTQQQQQQQQRRFSFFDKKMNIQDYKKMMYEKNLQLVKTAYECTMEAISICKHGVPFNKIAAVIDSCIKKKNKNYFVAPHLCGHNIGKNFHEQPFIIHTLNNDDRKMCENLVFTIEPIISEAFSDYMTWPDNWTISNKNYVFSAQFEHTIWIKKNEAEILTKKIGTSPKFEWEKNEEENENATQNKDIPPWP